MKSALLDVSFAAFLLAFAVAFGFADAETRYVSKTGSDTPPYTSWETAASSIQSAIDAASETGTVLIGPGFFMERITLKNFLTVRGAGQGVTIIRPMYGGPVVACVNLTSTWIEGLTITGGDQSRRGGGIYIEDSTNVVVRNCQVSENTADYQNEPQGVGGGICALNSDVVIQDCTIANNVAGKEGGGIFLGCAGRVCQVSGCEILGNTAIQGRGGGILCYSLGEIRDCVLVDNQAATDGGGIFCAEATVVDHCIIQNNRVRGAWTSQGWGVGIYHAGGPPGAITNCVLGGNEAESGGSRGVFWEADANVVNSTFLGQKYDKRSASIEVGYPADSYGTYENITNCLFAGETTAVLGGQVTYSLVPNLKFIEEGEGTIEGNPEFVLRGTCNIVSVGSYDGRRGVTPALCDSPLGEKDQFKHMFLMVWLDAFTPKRLIAGNAGHEVLFYGHMDSWLSGLTLMITDFSLPGDSPCIDAGNNEAEYLPDEDRGGNFRIWRGRDEWRVDMGAYEYGSRRFIAAVRRTGKPGDAKTVRVTWNSQFLPDKTYSVYLSPDLATWTLVGSNIPSQGETTSWIDPIADLFSSRFYQISSP